MAKFDLTDKDFPKVWSVENNKFVPYYEGTDSLGDYNKNEVFPSNTTGAKREKLNNPRYDYMPAKIVNEAYAKVAAHGAEKYRKS